MRRRCYSWRNLAAAADAGLKDHERWAAARSLLARALGRCRSTYRLPALLDLVLTRPTISAGNIARELPITRRAVRDLVGDLGLRGVMGRGQYRAWEISSGVSAVAVDTVSGRDRAQVTGSEMEGRGDPRAVVFCDVPSRHLPARCQERAQSVN